jgi:protein-tyrosine phosphatase
MAVEHLRERRLRSVIAHPDRRLGADLERRLAALIERGGALVQATAAHALRADTGPAMLSLASRGLIHVLGSDAHSSRHGRPVQLSDAIDALRGLNSTAPRLEWISRAAPEAILAGEDLEPPISPTAS